LDKPSTAAENKYRSFRPNCLITDLYILSRSSADLAVENHAAFLLIDVTGEGSTSLNVISESAEAEAKGAA
jgi:hypothetical protein